MKKLGVIDYNAGNITSVKNTLDQLEIQYFVSADPAELETAEKILFPGVGHAKSAMQELKIRGLDTFLQQTKKPVLGICVGMQLLFDWAEEGDTKTLGIINGRVEKFLPEDVNIIPHMGWNEVEIQNHPLFKGIENLHDFYFVHSYYCTPTNPKEILAITQYNKKKFCCAVHKENFFGVQFHPEKSGTTGQKIIKNFWEMEV